MKRIVFTVIYLLIIYQAFSQGRAPEPFWPMMNTLNANLDDISDAADAYWLNENNEALPPSPISQRAYGKWLKYWRTRVDSNGTRLGYSIHERTPNQNAMCPTGEAWQQLGPFTPVTNNFGGKGTGFVQEAWINPNDTSEMYIGGEQGGLYYSDNGGKNWLDLFHAYQANFPSQQVRALEVNDWNSQQLYVSLGEHPIGNGLWVSTNGGQSWNSSALSQAPSNPCGVAQKIKAYPAQNQFSIAWALTPDAFYHTTSSFQSVTKLCELDSGQQARGRKFLDLSLTTSGLAYASTDSAGLFRYDITTGNLDTLSNNLITNHSTVNIGYSEVLIATAKNRPDNVYVILKWVEWDFVAEAGTSWLSFQKSTDRGQTFTELAVREMASRQDFTASETDTNLFYLAGGVRARRIRINPNTGNWQFPAYSTAGWSPGATNHMHADVRDIDVILDNNGQELVYWSNDGDLTVTDSNDLFTNITDEDINARMVTGLHHIQGSDEIYAGVYHNGQLHRQRDGTWRGFVVADGSDVLHGHHDNSVLVFSSNGDTRFRDRFTDTNIFSFFPSGAGGWWNFVDFPMANAYGTKDTFYLGYKDLYILNEGDTGAFNLTNQPDTDRVNVLNIFTSKAHPGSVWFSLDRGLNTGNALFKSHDKGNTITALPAQNWFGKKANAIFVHPADTQQIWIGLSGYNQQERVFVSYDGGTSWVSMYSPVLGNFPINDFAYDEVTQILYTCTDFGVYYKDLGQISLPWKCWNNNLPTSDVVDLEIDKCARKLRASSYGRGIWEVDLVDKSEHTTITQTYTNQTIESYQEFYANGDLLVQGTMTIKGRVYMHEDANILVPPGAKVIVDGGIVSNACGGLWGGFRAWGEYHANNAGGRPYPQTDVSKHGIVQLKNSAHVEHAHVAVELGRPDAVNYQGGILLADQSTFYNNEVSVRFRAYKHHASAAPYGELNNLSVIEHCEFITDGVLDDASVSEPVAQLEMYAVRGMRIRANLFQDRTPWNSSDRTNNPVKRIGIRSWDASYRLDPICGLSQTYAGQCWNNPSADSNIVKGYFRGLDAYAINSVLPVTVRGARFDSNYVNMAFFGNDIAEIYRNDLHSTTITGNQNTASVYMMSSTGYFVQENNFWGAGNSNQTGLAVYNSGSDMNEVRKNYLEKLAIATAMVGDNDGNNEDDGLQYLCNTSVDVATDVFVNQGDISKFQGFCGNGDNSSPANDVFDAVASGVQHFHANGTSQQITYNQLLGEGPQYFAVGVDTNPCFDYEPNNGERCPKDLLKIHPPTNGSLAANNLMNQISMLADSFSINEDDITSVIAADSMDAVIHTKVLNSMPFITDEVLIIAISDKPTPMGSSTLQSMLEVNSPLSEAVTNVLKQHYPALEDSINHHVQTEGLLVSPSVMAQLEIGSLEREVKRLHEEILRYWLAYDTTGGGIDSALAFLQSHSGDWYRLREARLLCQKNPDCSGASAVIESMSTGSVPTDFNTWLSIMTSIGADSSGVYHIAEDETLETQVRNLASSSNTTLESYNARSMLNLVFGEAIPLPEIILEGGVAKRELVEAQPFADFAGFGYQNLMLSPNPARQQVTITYQVPEEQMARLELYSMHGNPVQQYELDAHSNSIILEINDLSPGVYVCMLWSGEKLIAREKLVVNE